MKLKGQVALITGGAQGIGKTTAQTLAQEGASLVLCDVDDALVSSAAQEIASQYSVQAVGLKANVVKFAECEQAVKTAVDKFGKLDILINNAGVTKDNLVLRMSEEEWDLVLDVNLKGPFNFTKAAAKVMLRQKSGRIINVASVVGQIGNIGQANYAASKGGLIALTKACAKEFASRNILVNAVAPGFIKTRLTENLSPEAVKRLHDMTLLSRFGEPQDVANAVLFLALPENSFITGQVLGVNGGMYV